jgi:hypothetical protein
MVRGEKRVSNKLKRKDCRNEYKIVEFLSIGLYKIEIMLGKEKMSK